MIYNNIFIILLIILSIFINLNISLKVDELIWKNDEFEWQNNNYDDEDSLTSSNFMEELEELNVNPMGGLNGVSGRPITPHDNTLVDKEQKKKEDEAIASSYRMRLDTHTACMPKKPTCIGGAPVLGPPRCIQYRNGPQGPDPHLCIMWNYACTRYKSMDEPHECLSYDMKKYVECWNWEGCGDRRQCTLWNYQCLHSNGVTPNLQCVSFGMKYGIDEGTKTRVETFYDSQQKICDCPENTASGATNITALKQQEAAKLKALKPTSKSTFRTTIPPAKRVQKSGF